MLGQCKMLGCAAVSGTSVVAFYSPAHQGRSNRQHQCCVQKNGRRPPLRQEAALSKYVHAHQRASRSGNRDTSGGRDSVRRTLARTAGDTVLRVLRRPRSTGSVDNRRGLWWPRAREYGRRLAPCLTKMRPARFSISPEAPAMRHSPGSESWAQRFRACDRRSAVKGETVVSDAEWRV
jgi:hypothetical protein